MKERITDKIILRKIEPNIIENIIQDNAMLEQSDFDEFRAINASLNNNLPYVLLVKLGYFANLSDKFIVKTTKKEGTLCVARALITDTIGHRIAGNFYLRIKKPEIKTQLFNSRESALLWLRNEAKQINKGK